MKVAELRDILANFGGDAEVVLTILGSDRVVSGRGDIIVTYFHKPDASGMNCELIVREAK